MAPGCKTLTVTSLPLNLVANSVVNKMLASFELAYICVSAQDAFTSVGKSFSFSTSNFDHLAAIDATFTIRLGADFLILAKTNLFNNDDWISVYYVDDRKESLV